MLCQAMKMRREVCCRKVSRLGALETIVTSCAVECLRRRERLLPDPPRQWWRNPGDALCQIIGNCVWHGVERNRPAGGIRGLSAQRAFRGDERERPGPSPIARSSEGGRVRRPITSLIFRYPGRKLEEEIVGADDQRMSGFFPEPTW